MTLEQEQFLRKSPDFSRLIPYGFSASIEGYVLSRDLMDGDFRAVVTVHPDGTVTGHVTDLDTEEEFYAIHSSSRGGAFVSMVREEYCTLLREIAAHCFVPEEFIFPQSNRLARALRDRFDEIPDHPFPAEEDTAVFRVSENRKWYGILTLLSRGDLDNNAEDPLEPVEVLNVKVPPEQRESLLATGDVVPCTRGSSEHWIGIVLDEHLPDETILALIRRSREYALRATLKRHDPVDNGDWILSINPIDHDVDHLFLEGDELWKQSDKIRTGDTVYFYVGRPVSALLLQCRVMETDIPYSYSGGGIAIRKVMRLHRIREYDRDQVPLEKLRKLGISGIRGARYVTGEFLDFIRRVP